MAGFSFKEISNPLTIGQRLKNRREEFRLTLVEVAKNIGISAKYLSALEDGDYRRLPGEVYTKSFLKSYVKFLGLDHQEILSLYGSEQKIYNCTRKTNQHQFHKPVERVSSWHLLVTPRIVRGLIVFCLALSCLVYLGFRFKAIVTPPLLLVDSPAQNLVTEQNFVKISGQIEPEATLQINGQKVLTDEASRFDETLDLQSGVNIIELTAQKRHGTQTKKYLQVVVVDNNQEGNFN
ncbi:MAG: helix-turn-helix domain-containing protein [Patescibacteria group bacterium]|jgi:cytoskeletal protein RodZ|nr:helix-turn-helix domain-containing protein [Patescibacteria group bacterium]